MQINVNNKIFKKACEFFCYLLKNPRFFKDFYFTPAPFLLYSSTDNEEEPLESVPDEPEVAPPPPTGSSFPAIWSEEGKYLATVLGDALVKGLTQVSSDRPDDPVEYLANFLKSYKNGEILASSIPSEVQDRLKSGRAVTPGLLERNGLLSRGGETLEEESPGDGVGEEAELDLESQKLIQHLDSDDEELDQINNLDEQDDPEDGDEDEASHQNGTRDDRGQSVLHFAAARPVSICSIWCQRSHNIAGIFISQGGASTILAFLQNPSVNLAWRDEKLRTARDVAIGLGRVENVKTIDGWIISLAIAGGCGVEI